MYKVGIAGLGFVGDAIYFGFMGQNSIVSYDPIKYQHHTISMLKDTEFVFICVPTPMRKDGSMDDSAVRDVLTKLESINYDGIAIIKSTVIPNIMEKLIDDYKDLKIVANPEFLTERRAREDFANTKWVLLGGDLADCAKVSILYRNAFPNANIDMISAGGAMMVKYMTNVFFSVKVSLMNEFRSIWSRDHNDWDSVVDAFSHDSRVNPEHLKIPGPDGDFGFGGKCFPKDLNAFMALAKSMGLTSRIPDAAWEDNKEFRTNKDWLNIDGAVTEDYEE